MATLAAANAILQGMQPNVAPSDPGAPLLSPSAKVMFGAEAPPIPQAHAASAAGAGDAHTYGSTSKITQGQLEAMQERLDHALAQMSAMSEQNAKLIEIIAEQKRAAEPRRAGTSPDEISAADLAKAVACARMEGDTKQGCEWWYKSVKQLRRICPSAAYTADLADSPGYTEANAFLAEWCVST